MEGGRGGSWELKEGDGVGGIREEGEKSETEKVSLLLSVLP